MFHDPTTRHEAALRRAAELRRIDLKHQEARSRALREVYGRLQGTLTELNDQNYGLVKRDLEHILSLLDDEGGTPQIVETHLQALDTGARH